MPDTLTHDPSRRPGPHDDRPGRAGGCTCGACDLPAVLLRNRFFPGKRMDADHWNLEQRYGMTTRALLARLGLGSGILCGLDVTLTANHGLRVAGGIAVDGCGRLVVVPDAITIADPEQPRDHANRPDGEPVGNGPVTLVLCAHECGTESVRMQLAECGHEERCEPTMVEERFRWEIRRGETRELGLGKGCHEIFPAEAPEDFDRRVAAELRLARDCEPEDETCIPVAVVTISDGVAVGVDGVHGVPRVHSNRQLYELILCLAGRVDECCRHPLPAAVPPRIVDMWPPLGRLDEEDWNEFTSADGEAREPGRLELRFDRDLQWVPLEDPTEWLGVWQFVGEEAVRLEMSRLNDVTHIATVTGQRTAAYQCTLLPSGLAETSGFAVLARTPAGGPVVALDPDGLALDSDLLAGELTASDIKALWALDPGGSTSSVDISHVVPRNAVLPSGDGAQGGELQVILAPPRRVAVGPRLEAVWPAGAARLGPFDDRTKEELVNWLERPRVELTLSAPIEDEALDAPDGWVRLWLANRDGDTIFGFRPLGLVYGEVTTSPMLPAQPGQVTYAFTIHSPDRDDRSEGNLRDEFRSFTVLELLLQVRPGGAATAKPLGTVVGDLLDADFEGTGLSSEKILLPLWTPGTDVDQVQQIDPRSSLGQQLWDGNPAGLAHFSFSVAIQD